MEREGLTMEVAVFSDIHNNYEAFKACFSYCTGRGIDRYLLLGDYVSDCPEPEKTMELVYILRDYFRSKFIRGNREDYFLNYRDRGATGWQNGSASGTLLYTWEHLTDRDLYFFEKLPITDVWEEPGYPAITLCHGAPDQSNGVLLKGRRNTRRVLSGIRTSVFLHGHHHEQEAYRYRDINCINPGSIGVPWNEGGKAQFAILKSDGGEWIEELVQLDYDREAEYRAFAESGLMERAPAWAALVMHTLRTGVDMTETVMLRATQLCREDRGEVVWPDIPEKYWAQALLENRIDLQGRDI
ncbi:MAG: metallophosphoesterase family protein [Lachnospiraceae bacterium]|nr:metallophosphoesterase family protein [Lachnospiraceae bacterium]